MQMLKLSQQLKALKPKEHRVIYTSKNGVKVTVTKTQKFSADDFAVGLIIPGRDEFYPTHIRLLFDLYLKRLRNPEGAKKLFLALEKVYDGEDPDKFIPELEKIEFPMQLDEPSVNLYCAQLLMIEQDFNFSPGAKPGIGGKIPRISKFTPPREFL
ncbi:MAG: hypothetical protein QXV37_03395, partial [Candidatus Jordarchaeaceae archaeon]